MSLYQHIEVPTSTEAVRLVKESIHSSYMVVLCGQSGVGRREPVRVIASEWEQNSDPRKVVLFNCMETTKPIDLMKDLLWELGAKYGREQSLRQTTRLLVRELKERRIGLLCISGIDALSRSCIEHIPRLFEAVRADGDSMGLVVTSDPGNSALFAISTHGLCQATVHLSTLDAKSTLGVMHAWDKRFEPILKRACQQKPQGMRCADIIHKNTNGNFERMAGFYQCLKRLFPRGPLTEERLAQIAKTRNPSLLANGYYNQLCLL